MDGLDKSTSYQMACLKWVLIVLSAVIKPADSRIASAVIKRSKTSRVQLVLSEISIIFLAGAVSGIPGPLSHRQ